MKNTFRKYVTGPMLLIANATALTMAIIVLMPQTARADDTIIPPAVPENIAIDATTFEPFLLGRGVGTQNYVCLPKGTGFAYVLFTPEATLFSDSAKQLTTHFFSPNPDPADNGAIRATWQHSRDTSRVWAKVNPGDSSTDAKFVASGAVAWLKLTVVGREEGPSGGDTLLEAKFVHRVNTTGGVAPATGCASPEDVGRQQFVPYTADYIFYRQIAGSTSAN